MRALTDMELDLVAGGNGNKKWCPPKKPEKKCYPTSIRTGNIAVAVNVANVTTTSTFGDATSVVVQEAFADASS